MCLPIVSTDCSESKFLLRGDESFQKLSLKVLVNQLVRSMFAPVPIYVRASHRYFCFDEKEKLRILYQNVDLAVDYGVPKGLMELFAVESRQLLDHVTEARPKIAALPGFTFTFAVGPK